MLPISTPARPLCTPATPLSAEVRQRRNWGADSENHATVQRNAEIDLTEKSSSSSRASGMVTPEIKIGDGLQVKLSTLQCKLELLV